MSNAPDPIWMERWNVLCQRLEEMKTDYGATSLGYTTRRLQVFAYSQFNFFHECLRLAKDAPGRGAPYDLNFSEDYSFDYVMATILHQTMKDMTVIQQVVDQRSNSKLSTHFERADKLAWLALRPARELGLFGQAAKDDEVSPPTLSTYFQKSAFIANIPYAPIALIGVPWTAIGIANDYLAIPHEVGHFVFQQGRFNGKQISEHLQSLLVTKLRELVSPENPYFPDWCYRWLEETFADIYGCLVAGPVMAQDFQDLQLERTQSEFEDGDTEHPLPILRPHIYTKVLQSRSAQQADWAKWAEKLHANWKTKRQALYPDGDATKIKMGVQDLLIKDLIGPDLALSVDPPSAHPVDVMVKIILDFLDDLNTGNWANELDKPAVLPDDAEEVKNLLYAKNKSWLADQSQLPSPPLLGNPGLPQPCPDQGAPPDWQTDLWKMWISEEKFFSTGLPPAGDPGILIPPGRPQDRGKGTDMWIPVLLARDWATEGPNGSWHPPKS